MFKKSFIISLLFILTASTVFASNIGRNVYGVLAETVIGVHFDAPTSDEDSIHWYTWSGTISQEDATGTAPEGLGYNKLKWNAYEGWVGCGWTSTNSNGYHNMSAYYDGKIKFLVRSSDANILKCKVGIEMKVNGVTTQVYKKLEDLGFSADGKWHELAFNLNTSNNEYITSTNLSKTSILFYVSQDESATTGNILDIDYIRWVKKNAPTSVNSGNFNVTLKNISDNSTASSGNIEWNSSTFKQGWVATDKYIELSYDVDLSTAANWDVKLYVNNGSKDRNGLYATKAGQEYVMPMCWRASDKLLPYTDEYGEHTTQIGEKYNQSGGYWYLYDSGSSSDEYSPWLYMQDLKALKTNQDKDYSTVLSYKNGFHGYSGVYGGAVDANGYYAVWNYIRIYLGCNTTNATGGLKYTGNICVVLTYE